MRTWKIVHGGSFHIHLESSAVMSSDDQQGDLPNRFSTAQRIPKTETIRIDVSNIPVGHLDPIKGLSGELSPSSDEFLRWQLFPPEPSSIILPWELHDDPPPPPSQQENSTHHITMDTTTGDVVTGRKRKKKRVKIAKKLLFYVSSDFNYRQNPLFPCPPAVQDLVGLLAASLSIKKQQSPLQNWLDLSSTGAMMLDGPNIVNTILLRRPGSICAYNAHASEETEIDSLVF